MKVSCSQVNRLKETYLDGGLPQDMRSSLEAHLALCPLCLNRLALARNLDRELRGVMKDVLSPPRLHSQRALAIRRRIIYGDGGRRLLMIWQPAPARASLALMLMVMLALGVAQFASSYLFPDRRPQPDVRVPTMEATVTGTRTRVVPLPSASPPDGSIILDSTPAPPSPTGETPRPLATEIVRPRPTLPVPGLVPATQVVKPARPLPTPSPQSHSPAPPSPTRSGQFGGGAPQPTRPIVTGQDVNTGSKPEGGEQAHQPPPSSTQPESTSALPTGMPELEVPQAPPSPTLSYPTQLSEPPQPTQTRQIPPTSTLASPMLTPQPSPSATQLPSQQPIRTAAPPTHTQALPTATRVHTHVPATATPELSATPLATSEPTVATTTPTQPLPTQEPPTPTVALPTDTPVAKPTHSPPATFTPITQPTRTARPTFTRPPPSHTRTPHGGWPTASPPLYTPGPRPTDTPCQPLAPTRTPTR